MCVQEFDRHDKAFNGVDHAKVTRLSWNDFTPRRECVSSVKQLNADVSLDVVAVFPVLMFWMVWCYQ